jgi:hypothetical protein
VLERLWLGPYRFMEQSSVDDGDRSRLLAVIAAGVPKDTGCPVI